jgi:uncharacterized protein
MGDNGWATMPSHISDETAVAVGKCLKELAQIQSRPFAVVLHGGEPLLLGPEKLDKVLSILRGSARSDCSFSLQTNGILITDELLDICFKHRTTISISIDGPKHIHDRRRVTFSGHGTFEKVLAGIDALRQHRASDFLYSGLLAVIDPESDPVEVYKFYKTLQPPGVDFLYRDGNYMKLPEGKQTLRSTEYGEWLARLLDVYIYDPDPLRIRFLDDLMKLLLGGKATKDGVGLNDFGILVIETDGSIAKNDTLKSSFEGADRFSQAWTVQDSLTGILNSEEFAEAHALQRPTCKLCLACPELKVCGGGMTLNRWRDSNGYDNPSIYCSDQLLLINHTRKQLASIQARCARIII